MASVLLPQPDGPTMDRNSPSRTSNDTPSSARTEPSGVGNTRTTSETSTNFPPLGMPGTAGIVLQVPNDRAWLGQLEPEGKPSGSTGLWARPALTGGSARAAPRCRGSCRYWARGP